MKIFQPGFWEFYARNLLPLDQEQRTAAVVFSSPGILGTGLGQLIDSHDWVVRFNLAPTRGHEADVGRKTTHRLVAEKDLKPIYFREGSELCIRVDRPHFSQLALLEQDHVNSKNSQNSPFFDNYAILSNHVQQKASALVFHVTKTQATGFSTGFIGLIYAMSVCTKVRLYAFEAEWPAHLPMHYYDNALALKYAQEGNRDMKLTNPGEAILAGFAEKGRDAGKHPHGFALERKTISALIETGHIEVP